MLPRPTYKVPDEFVCIDSERIGRQRHAEGEASQAYRSIAFALNWSISRTPGIEHDARLRVSVHLRQRTLRQRWLQICSGRKRAQKVSQGKVGQL